MFRESLCLIVELGEQQQAIVTVGRSMKYVYGVSICAIEKEKEKREEDEWCWARSWHLGLASWLGSCLIEFWRVECRTINLHPIIRRSDVHASLIAPLCAHPPPH